MPPVRISAELRPTQPLKPFLTIALLAFATIGIQSGAMAWAPLVAAGALTAVMVLTLLVAPWKRLPTWTYLLPPLATFAVIALLRHAGGGSSSGYGSLAILPVVWAALTLSRRAVAFCALAGGLMFAVPLLLIGGDAYPATGWRGTALWFAVALLVGLIVHSVVSEQRRHAELADERAADLAETQQTVELVAELGRDVSAGVDSRDLVCAIAIRGVGAAMATIVEPIGQGRFAITGSAGFVVETAEIAATVQPNASLRAFFARERVFVPNVDDNPGVSRLIVESNGLRSILYEPILRQGQILGVLCIGWQREGELVLDERTGHVCSFLAAEAGAAIERSERVSRLDELARTDQLTGLPNRRAWDELLTRALAEREGRLCVAIIDLDHFKRFNDQHGHPSGDSLVRSAARRWQSELRSLDAIARYGGEEFAVLLPGCGLEDARRVLERLRAATPGGVTASVGVAERGENEEAPALMQRADDALYLAKRSGRNRVIAVEPPSSRSAAAAG